MDAYKQVMKIVRDYVETIHGGNIREASKALGIKDPSVLWQWINGKKGPRLENIAPVLDIIGASVLPPDAKMREYDILPKYSAKVGAGGSLETNNDMEDFYAFRKEWIRNKGIHSRSAGLFTVVGDSMEPLLREGDTVLVDRDDTEIVDGRIYVVTVGDELKVKYVQKGFQGLILHSENPRYRDEPVTAPILETFRVHGRVRWIGKEL